MKHMKLFTLLMMVLLLALCFGTTALAINPVNPLWEHIPDGEPHIFDGRLYVYGSHETMEGWDVGPDYVLWSCPVDDLTDWTYHGVVFDGGQGSGYLTASDVVKAPDGKYYMYTMGRAAQAGNTAEESLRQNMQELCLVSDKPEGPFEYHGTVTLNGEKIRIFDPTLIEEDGRVFIIGGTPALYELDPSDMTTIIDGPYPMVDKDGNKVPYFMEASSIRKIGDTYVYLYATRRDPDDKFVRTSTFAGSGYVGMLEYCTSKSLYGPWEYKGILIDIGGDVIGDSFCGVFQRSNYNGNTHGSLFEIDGQWYITYHRQTGTAQNRRQCCIEPIDMQIVDGDVIFTQAERTFSGVEVNGCDAQRKYAAAYADYLTNEAYCACFDVTEYNENNNSIVDVTNSVVIGYRYLNFEAGEYSVTVDVKPLGVPGIITVELDDPNSEPIARIEIPADGEGVISLDTAACGFIEGKHGVYFNFYAVSEANICEFNAFEFTKTK